MLAMTTAAQSVSVVRLRIGVILFLMFWLPAYLLAPVVAAAFGYPKNAEAIFKITIVIMGIQTAIGIIGFLFAGKQIMTLRHVPRKQLPKTVWHLFWRGSQE